MKFLYLKMRAYSTTGEKEGVGEEREGEKGRQKGETGRERERERE